MNFLTAPSQYATKIWSLYDHLLNPLLINFLLSIVCQVSLQIHYSLVHHLLTPKILTPTFTTVLLLFLHSRAQSWYLYTLMNEFVVLLLSQEGFYLRAFQVTT